jgi:hypothetical protein
MAIEVPDTTIEVRDKVEWVIIGFMHLSGKRLGMLAYGVADPVLPTPLRRRISLSVAKKSQA